MDKLNTRRGFIRMAGQGLLLAPVVTSLAGFRAGETAADDKPPGGLAGRKESKLILNVRDFGATGDGKTKDTLAIQQAIDRCWILGGGEVLVPAGEYFTG